MTLIRRLSLAATIATLIQIGSGGLVRATSSGEGCPDWPRCFGRWIPPLSYHSLIEYSHRLIASTAIMLVLATAVVAVLRHRNERKLVLPASIAAATILALAGIGAAVVNSGLSETLVTIHIFIAMILVATLVFCTVNAYCIERFLSGKTKEPVPRSTGRLAIAAALAVLVLILVGADVRGSGAALVFPDWPLMGGKVIPALGGLATRHFLHRAVAFVAGLIVLAFVVDALRAKPRDFAVSVFACIAGGLFLIQALVGAAQIWTNLAAAPVAIHVWLSSLVWASLVAAFTVTRRLAACAAPLPKGRQERGRSLSLAEETGAVSFPALGPVPLTTKIRAYVQLMKPRIILLLLITTVPTMILAARGFPRLWLIVATLIGGTLAAGSANSINCFIDRDIDAVMHRTQKRPLPAHSVEPRQALAFGVTIGLASFAWLAWQVNVLSAILAAGAILFYVFVYTLALKRSTPQNIVIGGAAGAVPVLVGWAAVTGDLGTTPLLLFLVIYYWTPPHFWALAMNYEHDYEAAKVPMLPVIASTGETTRHIVLYSFLLLAVTLLFYPVAQMGLVYLASAAVLGAFFLRYAFALRRDPSPSSAMALFKYSITYLTLLFAAVALDALVHIG